MTFVSQLIDAQRQLDEYRLFPLPFGDGSSGAVTISANTDGGNAGAFGIKQCTTLNIQAGFALQCPAGSNNGGIVIAVSDVFTFAGSLLANGGNAGNTTSTLSGKGGDGAGGPTGAPGISGNTSVIGNGAAAPAITKLGSGAAGGSGAKTGGLSQSFTGGQGRIATLPATILPAFSANGFPYQQWVDAAITASAGSNGLDSVISRAFSKFALIAGATVSAGSAVTSGAAADIATGGGSGGSGGLIYVIAKHIKFVSGCAISATGGTATDGFSGGSAATASGGGGGQGGRVVIICDTYEGTPPTPNLQGGLDGRQSVNGVFTPATATARGATGVYTFISLRGQIA